MFNYAPPAARRGALSRSHGLAGRPSPALGANIIDEAKARLPEMKEAGNWFLVTGGFLAGDFILHQMFSVTEGPKTANFYFGDKAIWTIPGLLVGRLISDYVVKGSDFIRALTIATTAVTILQVRYLASYPKEFNIAVFLMHEALLIPLSLLITGPSPVTGFYGVTKK